MCKTKKIISIVTAFIFVFMMFMPMQSVWAAPSSGLSEVKISGDKTATSLGNGEYKIKFSIPGETKSVKPTVDVVFVLDKSSTADANFTTSLLAMLDKLAANTTEVNYKVGVVSFGGIVKNISGGLVDISDSSKLATLKTDIQNIKNSGGTDLQGGVMLGKSMLDSDTTTPASNKHFILMSDLRGYLFTRTAGGATYEMAHDFGNNQAKTLWVYDGSTYRYDDGKYTCTVSDVNNLIRSKVIPRNGQTVANSSWLTALDDSGSIFLTTDPAHFSPVSSTDGTAALNAGNKLIPNVAIKQSNTAPENAPTAYDKEIYLVGNDWLSMKNAGYSEYLLYSPWHGIENNGDSLFKATSEWFAQYIGSKYSSTSTEIGESLSTITSDIINTVQKGTLTDYVNIKNFTLQDDSFKLSYSGKELTSISLGNGSYAFGTQTNNVYPFVLKVDVTTGKITLDINIPISQGNKLELSFIEKYINNSAKDGATVPTNNESYIEYMNTTEFKNDPNTFKRYMNFTSPTVGVINTYEAVTPTPTLTPTLSLQKKLLTDEPYNTGDKLKYQIKVTNSGKAAATNVVVKDTPKGLSFVSWDKINGVTFSKSDMSWTIAKVEAGESTTITYYMTVNKGVDKFSNTAVISNVNKSSAVTGTVSANASRPNTGDNSNMTLWIILLATASVAAIAVIIWRKKAKDN